MYPMGCCAMCSWFRRAHRFRWQRFQLNQPVNNGQATLEAAFLIPVILVCLLLVIQPSILLYDRMVMESAAAEGCRILATRTASQAADVSHYENFVRHRLGSIPEHESFHVHDPICAWEIELQGSETASQVSVTIKNKLRLLPLFDFGANAMGLLDESGLFPLSVTVQMPTQPDWVNNQLLGVNPRRWVEQWE